MTYISAARMNPLPNRISTSSCFECVPDDCHFFSIWIAWTRVFLNLDLMVATSSSEISRAAASWVKSPSMCREQRVICLTNCTPCEWNSWKWSLQQGKCFVKFSKISSHIFTHFPDVFVNPMHLRRCTKREWASELFSKSTYQRWSSLNDAFVSSSVFSMGTISNASANSASLPASWTSSATPCNSISLRPPFCSRS